MTEEQGAEGAKLDLARTSPQLSAFPVQAAVARAMRHRREGLRETLLFDRKH